MAGAISACQSRAEKFYHLAQEKIEQRQFLDAVDLLENSAELEKNNRLWSKTQFEIARILRFEIHDYNKALLVYRDLILKSEDASIRLLSQDAIAEIYFENIQDYTTAVKEYLLLESLIKDPEKLEKIRLKIAQCYRYTGSFKTALEYIDVFSATAKYEKNAFLKLKAQTYSSLGQYDEAVKNYNQILANDPKYFLDENLYVVVAMAYEEKQDYKGAMAYLQQNKNKIKDQAYFDLRIKRLNEKLVNKPFTKGVRK
jgi:tetratricopeptide (TPR) repeat protein